MPPSWGVPVIAPQSSKRDRCPQTTVEGCPGLPRKSPNALRLFTAYLSDLTCDPTEGPASGFSSLHALLRHFMRRHSSTLGYKIAFLFIGGRYCLDVGRHSDLSFRALTVSGLLRFLGVPNHSSRRSPTWRRQRLSSLIERLRLRSGLDQCQFMGRWSRMRRQGARSRPRADGSC